MTGTADYTLTVDTITDTSLWNGTGTVSNYHYCGTWCNHWNTVWYTNPTTIYKYQVKCPKCKTQNWLELETTTPCRKCTSTLKAVEKTVDYEIEVEG